MARNYKREYAIETPSRRKARAQRNRARYLMMKKGLAHVGDGKDVGHKKAISKGGSNSLANLQMQDPSENSSFRRNSKRQLVSEISKREATRKRKKKAR
jgi:hypothetical protein